VNSIESVGFAVLKLKYPAVSVIPPIPESINLTLTKGIGSLDIESITTPLTLVVCADAQT